MVDNNVRAQTMLSTSSKLCCLSASDTHWWHDWPCPNSCVGVLLVGCPGGLGVKFVPIKSFSISTRHFPPAFHFRCLSTAQYQYSPEGLPHNHQKVNATISRHIAAVGRSPHHRENKQIRFNTIYSCPEIQTWSLDLQYSQWLSYY